MRTLQLTAAPSGQARDIIVRVGLPEPDPTPGGDFRVFIEIHGFGEPYARHFHGVDELQAFLGGCWLVSRILPALTPLNSRLTWLDGDDLGFDQGART